jgi:hypothetical protein
MSLIPTCVICDALLRGYNGDCLCERCKQPCPTCGGYVGNCQHPLRAEQSEGLELEPRPIGDGWFRSAA